MLDIREIEYWISRYENEADKLEHCVTLSALYYIRDHMSGSAQQEPHIAAYSEAAIPLQETLGQYGESEFLLAIEGKDPAKVWAIIDDLMDALQVVNRRAYDNVIRKLERL